MIQKCSIIINKDKSKEFISFLQNNAKDKEFWGNVKKEAERDVNKEKLDKLFKRY